MQLTLNSKNTLNILKKVIFLLVIYFLGFFSNIFFNSDGKYSELLNPFVDTGIIISKPLQVYSIHELQKRNFGSSKIVLEKLLAKENNFNSYLFSYTTLNKKMTGQINIPNSITANPDQKKSTIVMLRGYVPLEIYQTGVGTKNAATVFANAGYITIAPDFFGYGESDPEPEDTWQTRFEKPITVVELINSLKENGVPLNISDPLTDRENQELEIASISNIGIWAHSNGGQIALTTLEILQKPIPTTLWAPVTAPFPYSILYFSDELEDEGKSQRKWISMFEENYDAFDFSITKHLDSLTGPIQIQHGDADDAALIYWSQEFVEKIKLENQKRDELFKQTEAVLDDSYRATMSANILPNVDINLITYPNTNHNMVPNWDKAVQKDLQFFNKWLD